MGKAIVILKYQLLGKCSLHIDQNTNKAEIPEC